MAFLYCQSKLKKFKFRRNLKVGSDVEFNLLPFLRGTCEKILFRQNHNILALDWHHIESTTYLSNAQHEQFSPCATQI